MFFESQICCVIMCLPFPTNFHNNILSSKQREAYRVCFDTPGINCLPVCQPKLKNTRFLNCLSLRRQFIVNEAFRGFFATSDIAPNSQICSDNLVPENRQPTNPEKKISTFSEHLYSSERATATVVFQ